MSWLAVLAGIVADIPIIAKMVETIAGLFIKTPAEKQADTTADQQQEADQIAKTGRPKWD